MNIKRALCGKETLNIFFRRSISNINGRSICKGLKKTSSMRSKSKHFASNNQENRKKIQLMCVLTHIRENLLKSAEYLIKSSNPWSVVDII